MNIKPTWRDRILPAFVLLNIVSAIGFVLAPVFI